MRAAFPALLAEPALVYLDSAATTLLHTQVLAAMESELRAGGSAGRGGHRLGARATSALEGARAKVATHLDVDACDVVFTKSATEGIQLIATGWAARHLLPGDRVLVTAMEHHANLLPWRRVARETGAQVRSVGTTPDGDLDLVALERHLAHAPRVLALTHVSNVTGARVPIRAVVQRVRALAPDCVVVVDGSQAIAHLPVSPATLDVDFYTFSGHKAYGPLGVGVVWGQTRRWAETDPLLWGGGMVSSVDARSHTLVDAPWRFEAGTPNHVAAVGLARGLDLCAKDLPLANYAAAALARIPSVRVLGSPADRVGLVSFTIDGMHPHDIGSHLDAEGICVRVGHLCAEPYIRTLGATAAVRASFGCYSTMADVDRLTTTVRRLSSPPEATR